MHRLLVGLLGGLGALGLFAYGDIPVLRTEGAGAGGESTSTVLGDNHRFKPPAVLSSSDINRVLNAEAFETHEPDAVGVARYDCARVVSNYPTEDSYVHETVQVPGLASGLMAWGVYDGHAGSQVSRILERSLTAYVRAELSALFSSSGTADSASGAAVENAIKRAFLSLDEDIMSPAASALTDGALSFGSRVATLSPGYAGSCALLSLYDPAARTLRVACTGDSRAVLATRNASGTWAASDLSVDQNGQTPSELARLQATHPDEPEMIKGKRILGLAITRAFGDGRWKWDADTQETAHKLYNGPKARPQLKTPPYLTAEPEVTTTTIEEAKPSFMIMASDGLWDHMTSQQAVDLVGKWLEWNARGRPAEEPAARPFAPFDFYEEDEEASFQIREEWATAKDSNAATHLVRNALGGRNEGVLGAVLGFGPPWSRNVRDDITVQVVFFGDGWESALSAPSARPVQDELAVR